MTPAHEQASGQASEVWTSQLRIVAGRAVEEAPQVGFIERLDRRGRLVRLSILAEPASPGAEAFVDQFVRRLSILFDPAARSLTGAVKFALETTHTELRAWNRERLVNEQVMYGVSCVVERVGQPALLGQAGPTLGLLAGDAGLADLRPLTLYAHPRRYDDPVSVPIGGSDPLNLEFAAAPEAADGWALLLTSNAAPLFHAERRVMLSRLAVDEVLRYLYPDLLSLRDAAGLVVSLGAGVPLEPLEPPDPDAEAAPAAELDHELDHEADPEAADEWEAAEAQEEPEAPAEPPTEPPPAAAPAPPLAAAVTDPEAQEPAVAEWPVNPFAASGQEQVPIVSPPVAASGPPPSEPIMTLARMLPSLRESRREPAVERPQVRTRNPRARTASARRAGLVLIAMLLILASVGAVLLGPSLLQSDEDQFRSRVEQARNGLAASRLAVETEAARLVLQDALGDVELALEINPLAADALQLREEIEAVLAELNLVQPPGELTLLVDLSPYGPALALGAIRFGSGNAYVLDDAGGRVFSVSAEGAAAVIFQEGELLGLGDQQRAGRPLSIAWQTAQPDAGASGTALEDALWILDSFARLYRWTPSGVLLVPIPEIARLGSVDAVAATAGSIYLLDQAGGAVWRFAVERSELSPPARAIGRSDLLNANELLATVTASGVVEFLIASSDGRLRRFNAGEELPLALNLERSLLSPASLSLGAQSGLVYVVDRGEGRLIAIGADGSVVGQIQSPELAELRGAWVNEPTGQIIYALPTTILSGRLPARQE